MNTLFVIPTLGHGGAQRVIVDICNHLAQTPQQIAGQLPDNCNAGKLHLLTFASQESISFFYPPPVSVNLLTTDSYSLSGPRLCRFMILPFKLAKIIKTHNIQTIVSFQDIANFPTVIAASLTRTKAIISERQDTRFYNYPLFRKFARCLLYPLANTVVVQTEMIRDQMPFLVRKKTRVIPNACPTHTKTSNPESPDETGTFKAIVIGRLEPQKNLEFLIESCPVVFEHCHNWTLNIYGIGSLESHLKKLISTLKLEEKIFLRGSVTDVESVLSEANLFLFPSRYEGFPNALAEAISAGLPAIAFDDVSGIPELISNNQNGKLLKRDTCTAENFATHIVSLMNDHQRRKDMGIESKRKAKDYDPKIILSSWESVIGINKPIH